MKPLNVITLVFVILKLTNTIDWSWFYVLLPTIIHLGIVTLCLIVYMIGWIVYNKK